MYKLARSYSCFCVSGRFSTLPRSIKVCSPTTTFTALRQCFLFWFCQLHSLFLGELLHQSSRKWRVRQWVWNLLPCVREPVRSTFPNSPGERNYCTTQLSRSTESHPNSLMLRLGLLIMPACFNNSSKWRSSRSSPESITTTVPNLTQRNFGIKRITPSLVCARNQCS